MSELESIFPRPLSEAAVPILPPALVPDRTPMKGRFVSLAPQNASDHAAELYEAGHSTDEALRIWDYLSYGPWPDADSFESTLRSQSSREPLNKSGRERLR